MTDVCFRPIAHVVAFTCNERRKWRIDTLRRRFVSNVICRNRLIFVCLTIVFQILVCRRKLLIGDQCALILGHRVRQDQPSESHLLRAMLKILTLAKKIHFLYQISALFYSHNLLNLKGHLYVLHRLGSKAEQAGRVFLHLPQLGQ